MSTDAVRAALDAHDAEDAQAAADNTAAVERLNVQLQAAQDAALAAQQATALVQAAFDAYKLTHPDAPPPPPPPPATKVGWGFNLFNGWNGYSQPAAPESSSVMLKRLTSTFGPFSWGKAFNPGFLPATWTKSTQGELDPANPASNFIECFTWVDGSIASGSKNAQITAYIKSVPAGKRVILTRNEIDNHSPNWPAYVADMDHLFDLATSLKLDATVEVWDCFMDWSLDPASGPQWRDSWTNPKKRHGVIFDGYWNQAAVDKTGKTKVGLITAKVRQLGLPWAWGELGDRRPGTAKSTETSDATRAASLTNRLTAVLAADPAPQGVLWFDVVGSTGDHRILPADTATAAALKGFMQA